MGRVGAEESAAVGSQLLDGDDGRDRTAGDFLRPGGPRIVGPHRPGLERGNFRRRFEGHRHALGDEHNAHRQTGRKEDVSDDPPKVDVKVPHSCVPAQSANDGRQRAKSDAGGKEHVGHDKENLAEVRQVLFAGVVLQVGVGEERAAALKMVVGPNMPLPAGAKGRNGCSASTRKPNAKRSVLKSKSETAYSFQPCGPVSKRDSIHRSQRGG